MPMRNERTKVEGLRTNEERGGNGEEAPADLEAREPFPAGGGRSVLELTVNNHPGVMSHVCGLFARRAFNVEGILCLPLAESARSRIWLLVNEDGRLEQMIRQLEKLEDVLAVRRHRADHGIFLSLEEYFQV